MNYMDNLYDYLFHFNPYEQMWYAVKRDEKELYFSNRDECKSCLHAKDIKDLIRYLSTNIN
jgi:hypothetical protein